MVTLTDAFSTQSQYDLIFIVNQSSQDIADNQSVISWSLRIRKNSGSGYWWNSATGSKRVRLDGTLVLDTEVQACDFRDSTPQTIILSSGTRTLTHDADGTLTAAISAGVSGLVLGSASMSGTIELDRIPRGPRVRVSGTWRNTVAYVRVSGSWRIAIPYVRVSGTWRVGGG